jgi:hypothetical protein
MKNWILAVSTILMGSNAFAMTQITCTEVGPKSLHRKVLLNSVEGSNLMPYASQSYDLIVADASKNDETLHVLLKKRGVLSLGDVDYSFVADDGSVTFDTYSDERNSGKLQMVRGIGGSFNCEYASF